MANPHNKFVCELSVLYGGERLDILLAQCFPQFSRVTLQNWIHNSQIKLNGLSVKPSYKLQGKEEITLKAYVAARVDNLPQDIPLKIIYEDDDLFIINKPSGMVVHPGAGNPDNTLVNALIFFRPEQAKMPRAGLVHRLDKGTSGLIIAAKDPIAYKLLQNLIKERKIKRDYIALVEGVPISGGSIERSIGRDSRNRLKMTSYPLQGDFVNAKSAITHYRIKEKYASHSLLNVTLETGRTHQIRVHLSAIGYPLVGDSLYGAKGVLPPAASPQLRLKLLSLARPLLHAVSLNINLSSTKRIKAKSPIESDMQQLIQELQT